MKTLDRLATWWLIRRGKLIDLKPVKKLDWMEIEQPKWVRDET
jgi:hypothetical protein